MLNTLGDLSSSPFQNIEHVLFCKSQWIEKVMGKHPLIPMSKSLSKKLSDSSNFWFGPRMMIESDTRYVQLISYILVTCNGSVLCYQRGINSSEQRLKGKYSVGLGGHIILQDAKFTNGVLDIEKTIEEGASREIREELDICKVVNVRKFALLHSRVNTVDSVHCGLVEIWDINSTEVKIKDKSLHLAGFKSISELDKLEELETWSKLIINHLIKKAIKLTV